MCGIAGIFNLKEKQPIDGNLLKRMTWILRHRGPDEFGTYQDDCIGLGHARLSIIDIAGGKQPMHNEDKSLWVVFNGEIFNYIELREDLIKQGHIFYTHSDTEVLLHLYEEKGLEMFGSLNGQFAFALWDKNKNQLLLARDRLGIRPLFYTHVEGKFLFASEVKSLFCHSQVRRDIDAQGLLELCTFWSNMPRRTIFQSISELAPGHSLVIRNNSMQLQRYWQLEYLGEQPALDNDEEFYTERLKFLLKDSVRLRLRADVPVAAYLSGGLDSSFLSAMVKRHFNNALETFSVAFSDKHFDEASFQRRMADYIGTRHSEVACSYADISAIMPQVLWHAEKPLIRTAPAPLFLLAQLVRQKNIKVVLTGEGADEVLGGYDLFREAKIRRFWAQRPGSRLRPLLMRRLYSYIPNWPRQASSFLEGFYRRHLLETDNILYSHLPRWDTTSRIASLFSERLRSQTQGFDPVEEFRQSLPDNFLVWDRLAQAQYIEIQTLLSGNLLSSQGDRMMMGNSVEGRLPFLDYRVVEFCFNLPARFKLRVMKEKYLLKKIAADYLPREITARVKQAYRAPEGASFLHGKAPEYLEGLLSAENLRSTNYFDPAAVENLVKKCKTMDPNLISAKDNMALVAVISTLLLHKLFVKDFSAQEDVPLPEGAIQWSVPA